eukprot:gene15736-biopygen8392
MRQRPALIFFCCMSIDNHTGNDFYPLMAGAVKASAQRITLCAGDALNKTNDRIYSTSARPDGRSSFLQLHSDGDLALYETDLSNAGSDPDSYWRGKLLWSAGTAGNSNCTLAVETDGHGNVRLVLRNGAGLVLKQSAEVARCTRNPQGGCEEAPRDPTACAPGAPQGV